jgi:hypothetical protein
VRAKLEAIVNVATLVTCVTICIVLLGRGAGPQVPAAPKPYKAGDTVRVRNVDYQASRQTLLMFVRSGCRFCTESMDFYKRVADSNEHGNGAFRIVALTPEDEETTRSYLNEHSIKVDGVVEVKVGETQFSGTPTLVLVGHDSKIRDLWHGKLQTGQERQVLKALGIFSGN